MIVINFKNYKEAAGKNGLNLIKICEYVSKKFEVKIVVCPNFLDLKEFCKISKIPVFSQHVDAIEEYGAFTGRIIPKILKDIGVRGTLINHSERKLEFKEIKKAVEICKKFNLETIVCAGNIKEIKRICKLKPNFIAYEPKELIGGDISVSVAKPRIMKNAFEICKKNKVDLLVGAGIKNGKDVKIARTLGAKGILVASGFVKAKNKRAVLEDFAKNIKITGFFVGRFQPFHLGHLHAIKSSFDLVDKLIIGIGSAQYFGTKRNPFNADLREKMIRASLKNLKNFEIVKVPDFNDDKKWTNYCLKNFNFDVVITNSNHVKKCFKGIKNVFSIEFLKPRKIYRGTYIRMLMRKKDERWKKLVPKEVVKVIHQSL